MRLTMRPSACAPPCAFLSSGAASADGQIAAGRRPSRLARRWPAAESLAPDQLIEGQ